MIGVLFLVLLHGNCAHQFFVCVLQFFFYTMLVRSRILLGYVRCLLEYCALSYTYLMVNQATLALILCIIIGRVFWRSMVC